jgi:putative transposase
MPNYRRAFIEGTSIFITMVTFNRQPILIYNIDLFKEALRHSQERFVYQIIAFVVLPNHMHMIVHPESIHEYPRIIATIKHYFSHNLFGSEAMVNQSLLSENQRSKREKGIWQPRYWEHVIRDEADMNRHVDYIHYNPVKHKLSDHPAQWEYSSFHEFVKRGYYELAWGHEDEIEHLAGMNLE